MATFYILRRTSLSCPSLLRHTKCLFSTASILRSADASSPVLSSLRTDLKNAMRNKDTAKLSVLRSILADITNSSKTANPITTDLQLLALLKKRTAAGQTAVNEFQNAGREDLVQKEEAQIEIVKGYADILQGDMVGEEEVRNVVEEVIRNLKQTTQRIGLGDVVKQVLGPGGKLEGKMVEKKGVVNIIQELLGGKK
jgi:uncharacterized protein YqeY